MNWDGWAGRLETQRGPEDEPDGDGFSNLNEHALGTDPTTADSSQNFSSIDTCRFIRVSFFHSHHNANSRLIKFVDLLA